MKPTQEQLNDPKWWDDNVKPEYDYAFTTGPDWDGHDECIGTVEFAKEDGSLSSNTGLALDNDCWVLLAERPTNPAFVPEVGVECEFNTGGDGEYKKCLIVGHHYKTGRPIVDHLRVGRDDINHAPECWKFRPIKSERELFVDKINEIINKNPEKEHTPEMLYDLGLRFVEPTK